MFTWGQFQQAKPDLAGAGCKLIYCAPVPVGLGFLATTRPDGGPRIHPFCPMIAGAHLRAFLVPSPKRADLHRDRRYALHCYPPLENEDAFYVTGLAKHVLDTNVRGRHPILQRTWLGTTTTRLRRAGLFEFYIERCLVTKTTGHGDPSPQHTVWHAPGL